jgi:hypothetical protein
VRSGRHLDEFPQLIAALKDEIARVKEDFTRLKGDFAQIVAEAVPGESQRQLSEDVTAFKSWLSQN